MSAYDELVERVLPLLLIGGETREQRARAILAEVFRTLEAVTPSLSAMQASKGTAKADWLAMLRASPLAKPKEDAP